MVLRRDGMVGGINDGSEREEPGRSRRRKIIVEHKAEVAANPLMADCKSSVTQENAMRFCD